MKEEYFKQATDQIKNQESLQKAIKDVSGPQQSLQNQIMKGSICIQNTTKQLILNHKKCIKQTQEEQRSRKLNEIRIEKEELNRKLKLLKLQENMRTKPHKLLPIQKHEENKQAGSITGLVRNFKRFQKQLQDKTSHFQQQLQDAKREMNEQQIKIKEFSKNKRLKISKQNIQIIKQREQIRKKQHQQSTKQILAIKSKKPLFQKMNQRWKEVQEQQKSEITHYKQSIKKSRIINLSKISNHETKYQSILETNKANRQEKRKVRQGIVSVHFSSPFYHQIKQQENQKIREIQQKEHLPKIKRQRIKKYQKFVREQIKPNNKTTDPQQEQDRSFSQMRGLRVLSTNQLYNKGNLYMKQAHQNLDKRRSINNPLPQKTINKPIDYLKEMQMKRGENTQSHKKSNSSIVQSIIDQQDIHSYETIEKLRQAIENVEKKTFKHKSEYSLYKAMQMKLNVLEKYYELQSNDH